MNASVKSAAESALIALLAAGCCLWFLISGANADELPAARMVLLAIGLGCALVAHWVFMARVVKQSGRSMLAWMIAIVVFVPLGTAALLAIIASEDKPAQSA